jgi:hypothetical protein
MPRQPKPSLQQRAKARLRVFWVSIQRYIKAILTRQTFANLFMLSFILLTSIGAGLFNPALGFIVAGVACGIFGFLLGLE